MCLTFENTSFSEKTKFLACVGGAVQTSIFQNQHPPPINPQGYFLYINLGIRPNSNFRFRAENKAKFREPQLREKKPIDLRFFLFDLYVS